MNKNLILLNVLISMVLHGQDHDSVKIKPAVFSVNPKKSVTRNTSGINIGVLDIYKKQKINGLNLQANPLSLIYPLIPKAIPVPTEETSTVTVNGLHISTGGMVDGEKLNGVGISIYHHARVTNGVSVNFYNNTSGNLTGIHISGFANSSEKGYGLHMAFIGNDSDDFKGLQISGFNESKKMRGVQIGLVNKAGNLKGFQLGLWNVNEKRKLPLINWNFKAKTKKS